jgi:hypothetical protein
MRKLQILLFDFALLSLLVSCSGNSFKADEWQAKENRSKQINSLIRSKLLLGKSYYEVIQILGKEDLNSDNDVDKISSNQRFSIQYLTGGGRGIDFERLLITFDSGKVIRVEKYYD